MEKLNNTLKSNEKAITLIALVITIIVLLILAGISISMLSGDNGLLKRAGNARDETIVEQEKEQIELAYLSATAKKLGDTVDEDDLQDELDVSVGDEKTLVTGTNNLNVHFNDTNHNYTVNSGIITRIADGENNSNYVTEGIIKDLSVFSGGSAILLKNTGELYLITYNGENDEYIKYEEEQGTQIATRVKEYYEDGCYISTANELCSYDLDSKTSTTLASNVKEYYGDGYYLSTTNELCSYDWDSETSTTLTSDVKKYYGDGYYLSTANELCSYDWDSETSTTLASDVKEYYDNGYYLTITNELGLYIWSGSITIDNELKKYCGNGYYLTTRDELKAHDGRHTATIAEHVKEFCGLNYYDYSCYYINTSNELYNSNDKISNGVIRASTSWYEKDTGEIFLKYIEN